jgi:hypothetical protein
MIRKFGLAALLLVMGSLMAHAADINGKWKGQFVTPVGVVQYTYIIQQNGNAFTGRAISNDQGDQAIENGKIDGDNISFMEKDKFNGAPVTTKYTGKVMGNKIKLTRAFADFPPDTFTVTKQ